MFFTMGWTTGALDFKQELGHHPFEFGQGELSGLVNDTKYNCRMEGNLLGMNRKKFFMFILWVVVFLSIKTPCDLEFGAFLNMQNRYGCRIWYIKCYLIECVCEICYIKNCFLMTEFMWKKCHKWSW